MKELKQRGPGLYLGSFVRMSTYVNRLMIGKVTSQQDLSVAYVDIGPL